MEVNLSESPLNLSFEVQQMPPDGSNCYECKEPIYGKMFQYFMFSGNTGAEGIKFKMCEKCYQE